MAPKPKPAKGGDKNVKIVEPLKVYKPDPSVVKRLKQLNQIKTDCNLDQFVVDFSNDLQFSIHTRVFDMLDDKKIDIACFEEESKKMNQTETSP